MKQELKLGIFVVSVLVISFFVLNYLKGEDVFNREIELSARFESTEGLVASAPVYIKGYKAGKVTEVSYDSELSDFLIVCSVSKQFAIPADSKMTIYSVDIMGGKGVRIDLGTSDELAADGSVLVPAFEKGMMDVLSSEISPLMSSVSCVMDSLAVTITQVNKLLSDSNQESIGNILGYLESTISDLNSISSLIEGKSDDLNTFLSEMGQLSVKLNLIADKADSTVKNVNAFTETIFRSELESTISSLNSFLEKLNDPRGTVGSLLVDKSVYNSMNSLLEELDSLVDKINENPKKYLKISVF